MSANNRAVEYMGRAKSDTEERKLLPFVIAFFAIVIIAFLSEEIHTLEKKVKQLERPSFTVKLDNLHTYMRTGEVRYAWQQSYCKKGAK